MQLFRTAKTSFVLLTLALAAASAGAVPAAEERLIERTIPAAKLSELSVKARVGDIRVTTGRTDEVLIRLRIKPKEFSGGWFSSRREGDPAKAELSSETRGSTLHLDIRYPDDRDGIEEQWTIEAPARLAARLSVSVGNIEVRGLAGGLDLKVNVGDIEADIPEGDVDAEVNVGDIRVTTATSSYGRVRLDANVGDASISAPSGARPVKRSRGYGPGDSASLDGGGRDRIRLDVNVGGASLRISSRS